MSDQTSRPQLMFPGLRSIYDCLDPLTYPFVRFITGAVLFPHGMQKVFGAFGGTGITSFTNFVTTKLGLAAWTGTVVPFIELLGGLFVAIGLFTRFAAAAVACEMAYIVLFVIWPAGFFWTKGGIEYGLLLCLLNLAIVVKGGGKYSVDALIGKEL